MTGSTTSGSGCSSTQSATASMIERGEEHPRLRGVDPDVAGDRVELRADEPRRHLVDGGHLARVLRREGDDRRHAVDARRGERLQVGLDPGPSAGIGARNRDAAWNQRTPFAGMTRIRFDGCDLSLARGTPVRER